MRVILLLNYYTGLSPNNFKTPGELTSNFDNIMDEIVPKPKSILFILNFS